MNRSAMVQVRPHDGQKVFTRYFLLCILACVLTAAHWGAPSLMATSHQAKQLPEPNIHKLIKNMTWNELQASEHPADYYLYINRNISSGRSRTTEQIRTSQGVAELLLTVNGNSPSAQQRAANRQLLSRLVSDAGFRRSRLRDQRQDISRRDKVIQNLPDAFIYTYLGTTNEGLIHVRFRPDPKFNPSSRQALILQGMAGELWVDPSTQRMVKINGTLIKDVKIGWGFLAHLYKGGRFLMEQSQGSDGTWHQKLLSVDFDGTELIFKSLHVHEKQIRCCFEKVPDNLTIAEAVHRLRTRPALPEHWQSDIAAIEKSIRSR